MSKNVKSSIFICFLIVLLSRFIKPCVGKDNYEKNLNMKYIHIDQLGSDYNTVVIYYYTKYSYCKYAEKELLPRYCSCGHLGSGFQVMPH